MVNIGQVSRRPCLFSPGDSICEESILHNILWKHHCQKGLQILRSWFSFSIIKMTSWDVRCAPMNLDSIPHCPNRIPPVYWQTYLPIFKYQNGDDAATHLFRFHKHIHNMGVGWHEDSLMRIFMISLEGDARSWYEMLPTWILSSLKYFHTTFHEHFKYQYPSLLLL